MTPHVLRPGFSRQAFVLSNPFEGFRRDPCPEGISSAVHSRDGYTCRACGFSTDRFNETAPIADPAFLPEDFVTLCRACWMVENIDRAALLTAAKIIWAPELDQIEINRAMPLIYLQRDARTSTSKATITRLLKTFDARRIEANRKLNHKPNDGLLRILSAGGTLTRPKQEIADKLNDGFRLWPNGRWVERAGQQEFNTFPNMLSHWRRMIRPPEKGNFGAKAIAQDWLARLA